MGLWGRTKFTEDRSHEEVHEPYKGRVDKRTHTVLLYDAALQNKQMPVPKYDHQIIGIYDDWDTFIKKTGGLDTYSTLVRWKERGISADVILA